MWHTYAQDAPILRQLGLERHFPIRPDAIRSLTLQLQVPVSICEVKQHYREKDTKNNKNSFHQPSHAA